MSIKSFRYENKGGVDIPCKLIGTSLITALCGSEDVRVLLTVFTIVILSWQRLGVKAHQTAAIGNTATPIGCNRQ
jgi:hypothetical protein